MLARSLLATRAARFAAPLFLACAGTVAAHAQETWSLAGWHPYGTGVAGGAYDSVRREVVSVTADGEVWAWNGTTWVLRTPAMAPYPYSLEEIGIAFDEQRGVLVVFGGGTPLGESGSTYEWDGVVWTDVTPATGSPSPRAFTMMSYAGNGKVLAYGGRYKAATYSDAYLWDGTNWTQVANGPTQRWAAAMSYDSYLDRVLFFGGADTAGTAHNDTWAFNGSTWNQLAPVNSPPLQELHRMAFDRQRRRMLVFGNGTLTWAFENGDWRQLNPTNAPDSRNQYVLAYDALRDRIVLSGGYRFLAGIGTKETWVFDADVGTPTEVYLSDYIGGASGDSMYAPYPPFLTQESHSVHGIGVDVAGLFSSSPIDFSDTLPFAKGIGAHPDSQLDFDLDAIRSASGLDVGTFEAVIGIDPVAAGSPTNGATFEILLDGVSALSIPIAGTQAGSTPILLDVTGVQTLTLSTTTLGGAGGNHACWAVAKLTESTWPVTFCTAKVNSLGCSPSITGSGWPSASATSGLDVVCTQVRNNKAGLFFYNVTGGQNAAPFQCGTLCLKTPVRRTPAQFAGGTLPPANDCSGVYSLDFHCFAAGACGGSPNPALRVAGTEVHVQAWGRDQGFAPPCNSMLSDGLEYVLNP